MTTKYTTQTLSSRIKLVDTTSGGKMGMMEWESVGLRIIMADDGSVIYTAFKIYNAKCYCSTKTFKDGAYSQTGGENASKEILNDKLYNKFN